MSSRLNDQHLRQLREALRAAWDERELRSEELARVVADAEGELAAGGEAVPLRGEVEAWIRLGRAYAGLLTAAFAEAER
jgi:hypothetical protein